MAVNPNTLTTLDALFKEVYPEDFSQLIPEYEDIMSNIEFMRAGGGATTGDFVQPVVLSRDHGITFLGSDDASQALNLPVPRKAAQAKVKGSVKVMRTQVSYAAAARAIKGKQAFVDGVGYSVESLVKSFAAIQEASHWAGEDAYAYADGVTADLASNQIVVDQDEWAPALWIGADDMPIDIYSVTNPTNNLTREPNTLVLSTTVTAVDMTSRTLTLASVAGLSDGVNYAIMRKGEYGKDSQGMHRILANQSTLFNINAATYPLWRANQYDATGNLKFATVADAVSKAMGRGLRGPIKLWVHSTVFQQLFPDFLTLKNTATTNVASRRFDNSKDVKNLAHGTDSVEFTINGVKVEICSSEYVRPQFGYGVCVEDFMRIGSSPMTWKIPGSEDDRVFFNNEDSATYELRMFSDEALFCRAPNKSLLLYGITL